MVAEETKITVAHLLLTLDRIEQWLGAARMAGFEARAKQRLEKM